jgi:hypothetical protein
MYKNDHIKNFNNNKIKILIKKKIKEINLRARKKHVTNYNNKTQ